MRFKYLTFMTLVFLISPSNCLFSFFKKPNLSPVIFVPGDGGSQMNVRLNKSSSPYFFCAKQSDWFNIWLNLELLVVPAIYCWIDNVKLYYDNVTRTTHNSPGVEISVPGWGDPRVVEWLDPTLNKAGVYFNSIGDMLVKMGYERNKNIRGAPYDFRKAPNELQQYFIDLKYLVEETYVMNDETPVTFISHSMGSPLVLVFLQRQSSEWKAKYIRRQISLAGAWAGSMKALKVFAMGDDLQSLYLFAKILREEQITHPSTAWLLPSPLFWKPSEVLVETPNRVYTMSQMQSYFNDIGYPTGWEMRKDVLPYIMNFSPSNVELYCIYGNGVNTIEKLVYSKADISNDTPKLVMGKGDGTVNSRSLSACKYWVNYQAPNISSLELPGVDHMSILSNPTTLKYIKSVLEQK